jgi:hypothetical protein
MKEKTEDILKDIIQNRGIEVCADSKRLQSMLYDLTEENKGKIKAIISALEENLVSELMNHSASQIDIIFYNRLVTKLNQDGAIDQAIAEWAVDCWIYALNKKLPNKPKSSLDEANKQVNQAVQKTVQQPAPLMSPQNSVKNLSSQPMNNTPIQSINQANQTANGKPSSQTVNSALRPKRRSFPFIRIAIAISILSFTYNFFIDSDREDLSLNEKEEAAVAAMVEEVVPRKESEVLEYSEENEEVEENLTASVKKQEIINFMEKYIALSMDAANKRKFSIVEHLLDPNGKIYNSQQNYMQYLGEKGITEQSLAFEVKAVEVVNKEQFKVKTYEEYEIDYNGNIKKFKSFNSEYLLSVIPGPTLLVNELVNTEQVDSYEMKTGEYALDFNNVDEILAIESAVISHYNNISNDDFVAAYNAFSTERKKIVTMDGWVQGLQANINDEVTRIEVSDVEEDKATVYMEMTSYDDNGDGTTLVQKWGGYWHLVKENGHWSLDDADIEKLSAGIE